VVVGELEALLFKVLNSSLKIIVLAHDVARAVAESPLSRLAGGRLIHGALACVHGKARVSLLRSALESDLLPLPWKLLLVVRGLGRQSRVRRGFLGLQVVKLRLQHLDLVP